MTQNTPEQREERPQQETAQQAPKSNPAPSDHFSLSTNFKLIPPLENAQRSRYPMVLSVSTSEDEVFALPSISGVPQHLLVGTQENHVPLNQRPRREQVSILENYLMRAVMNRRSSVHRFLRCTVSRRLPRLTARYLPLSWKKPSGYLS